MRLMAGVIVMAAWSCVFSAGMGIAGESEGYVVGADDVLDISVLQPEKIATTSVVTPDGSVSFPYIGSVDVKGLTVTQIQEKIQSMLAEGYMKFPVVSVSVREAKSHKFFVYGEVIKPGAYPLESETTILKAISIAGGFTKYGSSSSVKILRPRLHQPGYQAIKVKIAAVMSGASEEDVILKVGDIVVVSEGIF